MSGFNIDNSVNVSTSKPALEGFKIHNVEFKGVEKGEYKGGEMHVIVVKFDTELGQYRDTIFEPKPDDYKRTVSQYGENPSVAENIQDYFKQLIAAVNPVLYKEITDGTKVLVIKSWEDMRNIFVDSTKDFIGVNIQIKLDKDKNGLARFPGFPLSINKDKVVYRNSTYIGTNLAFTPKELKRISSYVQATPTSMARTASPGLDDLDEVPKTSASSLKIDALDNL